MTATSMAHPKVPPKDLHVAPIKISKSLSNHVNVKETFCHTINDTSKLLIIGYNFTGHRPVRSSSSQYVEIV
eukprot:scaffold110664_cov47-Attheya_sp.AAC.4